MPSEIYNALKLSEYRPLFQDKRVLVIGAGAVGSYLMEFLAKMGVSPDALDFDTFTLENAAKHGCLVRTPEDAGRNKARCVSERVQPLLDEGCTSHGIQGDVCNLGPEAFADYDVVMVAVDNFAAKVLVNELIRQLPESRRPVVVMDGTNRETAQSVILDNTEFCLRCLLDEKWMKEAHIRTSCTGPRYRDDYGTPEIVRTTNRASSLAAYLSTEQFHGYVLGAETAMNRMLTYTAYPNLALTASRPLRKPHCPGCAIHPPAQLEWLQGNGMEVTLREALGQLEERLGTRDFEISVHRLHYKNVVHAGFIVTDVCHSCGKPIRVMRHEGRITLSDLRCEACRAEGKLAHPGAGFLPGEILRAFTFACEEEIQDRTLYELGYPLGAHLEVIRRNGALDFLDSGKVERILFALDGDHEKIHHISEL